LVSAFTAPTTAAPGEPILVTDTTKNQGAAAAGSTVTSFYLSFNSALDASDVLLGSRTIDALNGAATNIAQPRCHSRIDGGRLLLRAGAGR
jgi:subtilase family serine protease